MSRRKLEPATYQDGASTLEVWWDIRVHTRPREVINLDEPGNFTMAGHVPWARLGPHHAPRDPNAEAMYLPTPRDPSPEMLLQEFGRAYARGHVLAFQAAVQGGQEG